MEEIRDYSKALVIESLEKIPYTPSLEIAIEIMKKIPELDFETLIYNFEEFKIGDFVVEALNRYYDGGKRITTFRKQSDLVH